MNMNKKTIIIVILAMPSVTVFVPPSTSVTVAEAAIRSVSFFPSCSVIADVVKAFDTVGST